MKFYGVRQGENNENQVTGGFISGISGNIFICSLRTGADNGYHNTHLHHHNHHNDNKHHHRHNCDPDHNRHPSDNDHATNDSSPNRDDNSPGW